MEHSSDLETGRARCMTWPLPRPDFDEDATKSEEQEQVQREQEGSSRKSSSRRNAWGNFSYADLITKAIQSSPEQRLTLSQIYEWMVNNVPYFKDKGESNSSAGWKNSIRHNLSLHSRFVRVQNEGTGKSSWWTLNSDAKPGKATRRRAGSIDGVVRAERRRGRMKKSLKPISDSTDESSELGTPGLSSPGVKAQQQIWARRDSDYMRGDRTPDSNECESPVRSRTTSNASSCGRPSPIIPGGDLDGMAAMSPMFQDYIHGDYLPRNNSSGSNSELVDTFDSMIIQSPYSADVSFPPMMENGIPSGGASLHTRHSSQYSVPPNQQLGGMRSPREMHTIPSGGYNNNQQQFNLPSKAMMMQSRQSATAQHQSHVYDHLQHHQQQQQHQFQHHEPFPHQGTPSQSSHLSMAHDSNELFGMLPSMNNNVRDEFGNDNTSMLQDYSSMGQNNYSYNNAASQQADLFSTQSYQTQGHDLNEMEQMPMMSGRHRQQNLNQVNMANLHQPMMHSQNMGQQHQVQHRQQQQHQGINQFNVLNEKLPNDEEEFDLFHHNIEYDNMPSELMHDSGVLLDNTNNPLLPVSSMQSVPSRPVTTTQQ